MCGIVGYVGPRDCTDVLVSALTKLEYRGYDSAGIAVFEDGPTESRRTSTPIRIRENASPSCTTALSKTTSSSSSS